MNEELLARFLPRFIETANKRLATLTDLMARRNDDGVPAAVRGEFHSLAGEASMLGLVAIGNDARAAENAAVAWIDGDNKAMMTCLRAIRPLNKAIAALAPPAEAAPADAKPSAGEAAGDRAGLRVLVVDDSIINADAVVDALDDEGIPAQSASDLAGVSASLNDFGPQLVLSDVNMPDLELTTLIAHVRQHSSASVYLLSGLEDAELATLSSEVGADGYVAKSAGLDALVAKVKAHSA